MTLAPARRPWPERADWLALAALPVLVLAFTWQISLAGRILAGPDAFAYFYPMYEYASSRLLHGQLPLWDPYLFLGAPFLANPQAGVLYPLHWPLLGLAAPSLATATLCLHYALTACFMYLFLRIGLRCRPVAAASGAIVWALGGLAGSQAEHFNQVEALAWLPLQALLLEEACFPVGRRRSGAYALYLGGAAVVTALQLLAGHAQVAYISLATLALYGLARASLQVPVPPTSGWTGRARAAAGCLGFVLATAVLGVGLAGAQLVPTLELSRLSVRAGGLSYREAVSFSFGPRAWLLGLMPHFGGEEPFSEYLAYIGVTGSLLAAASVSGGGLRRWLGLSLTLAGLFLALGVYNPAYYLLYRLLPGLSLFRVPARWLLTAVFGLAILVADGVEQCAQQRLALVPFRRIARPLTLALAALVVGYLLAKPRPSTLTLLAWAGFGLAFYSAVRFLANSAMRTWLLVVLLVGELYIAAQALPYNQATAAQVYSAQRRAPQVLAAEAGRYRFLAVSSTRFDPGDMADVRDALAHGLSQAGRYAITVASKWQEVMARNLAIHAQQQAVDGYDGGVLPTEDFLHFQSLYLPPGRLALDGRMSEHLERIPSARLLALSNIRYLLRDRVDDVWVDGVYYDLEWRVPIAGNGAQFALPSFPSDSLGVIVELQQPPQGVPVAVAELEIRLDGGSRAFTVLRTSDGVIAEAEGEPPIISRPIPGRADLAYILLPLPGVTYPSQLQARELGTGGLALAGISLVNRAAGVGVPVTLAGQAWQVLNYGDIKLYAFDDTLPRAYFSPCAEQALTSAEALARMAASGWDARHSLLVDGPALGTCSPSTTMRPASVVTYEPELVRVRVEVPDTGYLVLLDAYYPGWMATVDGAAEPIMRANSMFRAVLVPAGDHTVEFRFRPDSLRVGGAISLVSVGLLLALVGVGFRRYRS